MIKRKALHHFMISIFLSALAWGAHAPARAQVMTTFVLKGEIIDRPDDDLVMIKPTENFWNNAAEVIKVQQGSFTHVFEGKHGTFRRMAFDSEVQSGPFQSVDFFLDQDTIYFTLYPESRLAENKIRGGQLNHDYDTYYKQLKQYVEPLLEAIEVEKERVAGGEMTILALSTALSEDLLEWQYAYKYDHPSEIAFLLLMEDALYKNEDSAVMNKAAAAYGHYAALYPDHPYVETVGEILLGVLGLNVGGYLIDFEAPDLQGVQHRLSDLMTDEIMLIDFWGSWCGPCIAKTRTMVPLYQEYKDRGFGVVGIAREFKNTAALEKCLERESFDWLNLVELDDSQGIWQKYGMSNAGGRIFLVSKDGTILAVDPTADEVRQVLEERLK